MVRGANCVHWSWIRQEWRGTHNVILLAHMVHVPSQFRQDEKGLFTN